MFRKLISALLMITVIAQLKGSTSEYQQGELQMPYICKKVPRVIVQGKRPGQPVEPLPIPTHHWEIRDAVTSQLQGNPFHSQADAERACQQLNDEERARG